MGKVPCIAPDPVRQECSQMKCDKSDGKCTAGVCVVPFPGSKGICSGLKERIECTTNDDCYCYCSISGIICPYWG